MKEMLAEAKAFEITKKAEGDATAIHIKGVAKAEAIALKGQAEAEAMNKKALAYQGYKAAASEYLFWSPCVAVPVLSFAVSGRRLCLPVYPSAKGG